MCGICGQVDFDKEPRVAPGLVEHMMDAMFHRGPDDGGLYVDNRAALGHRRLSIIDVSGGKQPLSNEDGTIWVVFNGEIYNFKELRRELVDRGHVFRTNTDTEVIVHLYEDYGEECVSKFRGMFAFALWDKRKELLLLARDPLGIKPVYYHLTERRISFASEIKALIADPEVGNAIDPQAIHTFLTYLYSAGPDTLLQGVKKLEPGHYLVLKNRKISIRQYWDLNFCQPPWKGTFDQATNELDSLLRETVNDHMISDVPVGVLLSGGIDSSSILSYVAEDRSRKVKTFTIGFSGGDYIDERPYARMAAEAFGSEHHEVAIDATDFAGFLPKYVWHMEEPVCEPPAVALYHVTKLAREHVKVLLSGEGGDEAFGGYQNYRNMMWLERWKTMGQPWVAGAESVLATLDRLGLVNGKKYSQLLKTPFSTYYHSRTSSPFSLFNQMAPRLFSSDFGAQVNLEAALRPVRELLVKVSGQDVLNQMLYVDSKTWLPDDLLVKADKMTMANSVELRVPLLDQRVMEFAARLPVNYKVRGLTTKHILKRVCRGRLPKQIVRRKKMGFPAPFASWLQKELRDYTWDILTDSKTTGRGYFEKKEVINLLNGLSSDPTCAKEIFSLVVLELWHRTFVDGRSDFLEHRDSGFTSLTHGRPGYGQHTRTSYATP